MSETKIAIQGIPYDQSSSFLSGCAEGPAAIRNALHSGSGNYFTEAVFDLQEYGKQEYGKVNDAGDVLLGEDPIEQIERQTKSLLENDCKLLTLGGDHFITYPILKAFAAKYGKVNLIQLDAHPDLYDELDGSRYSHACPFARAHEDGLIKRHVQIGVRTMTTHQEKQAERFGVERFPIHVKPFTVEFEGPLYITLDLDVLDPAFAPGVSHYEPGGLSVRDVLNWLHTFKSEFKPSEIVGADIVELNPTRDFNGMTAMVAAKFYKELMGLML